MHVQSPELVWVESRARIPRDILERNGLTSGNVHVEATTVAKTLLLCEPTAATGPALATLGYAHPTLLYVPLALHQGYDLTRPVIAKPPPRGVLLSEAYTRPTRRSAPPRLASPCSPLLPHRRESPQAPSLAPAA